MSTVQEISPVSVDDVTYEIVKYYFQDIVQTRRPILMGIDANERAF